MTEAEIKALEGAIQHQKIPEIEVYEKLLKLYKKKQLSLSRITPKKKRPYHKHTKYEKAVIKLQKSLSELSKISKIKRIKR